MSSRCTRLSDVYPLSVCVDFHVDWQWCCRKRHINPQTRAERRRGRARTIFRMRRAISSSAPVTLISSVCVVVPACETLARTLCGISRVTSLSVERSPGSLR